MIKVVPIPGKGRGVVATEPIEKSRLICRAPIISGEPGYFGEALEDHVCRKNGQDHLVLGVQTICNHSNNPNCACTEMNGCDLLYATRNIAEGEELTLDYTEYCELAVWDEYETGIWDEYE